MRTSSLCPKCGHNEILHTTIPDNAGQFGLSNMRVAMTAPRRTFLGASQAPVGELYASVCRRCGFCELYVHRPETIPVDGKWVTRTVGQKPER
jgi:predicted nucleic-acid-binding Zn-ribbon protein